MELERQHACAQHVLHCMNGHYNLLLCYLSALCTIARSALIISIAKRADNLRFIYTTIYTKVNSGAFTAATGGRENSNGRTKKTVGTTYFSTSRYSNSAILARKRHNHVHLLRAVPAHDLQCRQIADVPTHRKCMITSDLEPISAVCRQFSN